MSIVKMVRHTAIWRVGESKTAEHRFEMRGERFKGGKRGRFYTQRVVGIWYGLSEEMAEVCTITTFTHLV